MTKQHLAIEKFSNHDHAMFALGLFYKKSSVTFDFFLPGDESPECIKVKSTLPLDLLPQDSPYKDHRDWIGIALTQKSIEPDGVDSTDLFVDASLHQMVLDLQAKGKRIASTLPRPLSNQQLEAGALLGKNFLSILQTPFSSTVQYQIYLEPEDSIGWNILMSGLPSVDIHHVRESTLSDAVLRAAQGIKTLKQNLSDHLIYLLAQDACGYYQDGSEDTLALSYDAENDGWLRYTDHVKHDYTRAFEHFGSSIVDVLCYNGLSRMFSYPKHDKGSEIGKSFIGLLAVLKQNPDLVLKIFQDDATYSWGAYLQKRSAFESGSFDKWCWVHSGGGLDGVSAKLLHEAEQKLCEQNSQTDALDQSESHPMDI